MRSTGNKSSRCVILLRNDAGRKKKRRSRMQYIDNINKWERASLEENITRSCATSELTTPK